MAKPIYLTAAQIERACDNLKTSLLGTKCYGDIHFKKALERDERYAVILFSQVAWIKITELVARYSTEVQWHGLVRRIGEGDFEVYDIIVPPHEVTGATVTSDYEPYTKWLDTLDDDTFNNMRFHGHSHVDMSVSPSSVDMKYRNDLVTQLPKPDIGNDVFYIFMIVNKKHEWSAEIYDLTNNAYYDEHDIYFDVEDMNVEKFITSAKELAVVKKIETPKKTTDVPDAYNGRSYYSCYKGGSDHRKEFPVFDGDYEQYQQDLHDYYYGDDYD